MVTKTFYFFWFDLNIMIKTIYESVECFNNYWNFWWKKRFGDELEQKIQIHFLCFSSFSICWLIPSIITIFKTNKAETKYICHFVILINKWTYCQVIFSKYPAIVGASSIAWRRLELWNNETFMSLAFIQWKSITNL